MSRDSSKTNVRLADVSQRKPYANLLPRLELFYSPHAQLADGIKITLA